MSLIVRVIAPTGRDTELITAVLQQHGLVAENCRDILHLLQSRDEPIGPLLIAEEALNQPLIHQLGEFIQQQPAWSDLPLLILTNSGRETMHTHQMENERLPLGSPILLERPIRTMTLISSVRAALRARQRQYEIRDALQERDRVLEELSRDRETLAVMLEAQKQAEAALVQSEKLAAVGRLAASISHEINNPLESVTNLLYLSRQEKELSGRVMELLDTADQELRRVSQIVNQTLRFHRQSTRPRAISVEELLEPALGLYHGRLINSNINLQVEHRGAGMVTCYEGEIRQVLNNLIGNAIEAMRKGGQLVVRTSRSRYGRGGQPRVRISIADTGHGIPQETLKRIFEPFYTTKGLNGTGLGLWISLGIVEKHNGHLQVYSSTCPGKSGTVFSLLLPAGHAA